MKFDCMAGFESAFQTQQLGGVRLQGRTGSQCGTLLHEFLNKQSGLS